MPLSTKNAEQCVINRRAEVARAAGRRRTARAQSSYSQQPRRLRHRDRMRRKQGDEKEAANSSSLKRSRNLHTRHIRMLRGLLFHPIREFHALNPVNPVNLLSILSRFLASNVSRGPCESNSGRRARQSRLRSHRQDSRRDPARMDRHHGNQRAVKTGTGTREVSSKACCANTSSTSATTPPAT